MPKLSDLLLQAMKGTDFDKTLDKLAFVSDIVDDVKKFDEAALSGTPTANSLANFIATGGTALGTALPASKSLYDICKYIEQVAIPASPTADTIAERIKAIDVLTESGGSGDLAAILVDTKYIHDTAIGTPTAYTLADILKISGTEKLKDFVAKTGGTEIPASKSIYDALSGGIDAVDRVMGKTQVFEKSITAAANAGDTTVATITTQPCVIDSVIIHADTAQTTDMTTCAVTAPASKVVTFIGTADATQTNLDAADKQVAWTGAVRLAATKTIVISLAGTGATAVDLTIVITYHSCADGGYLT